MYACRIDERHFAHAYDANFRTISECCHDFLKLISRTKEIWSVYFVHFHILGYGVVVEIRGKKIEFFVQIYFVIGYGFHISGFRHSLHEQQTRNNKTHFYGNRQIEDYGKEKSYQKHSYIAFGVFHQSKEGPFFLANRTNARIMPVRIYAKHALRCPTWDRFQVPLPFSRVVIRFGHAWDEGKKEVPDIKEDTLARAQARLEKELHELAVGLIPGVTA